jgi:hypothetical protein
VRRRSKDARRPGAIDLGCERLQSCDTITPDATWKIAEVADFDGDGKSDILWRNDNARWSNG